MCLDFMHRAQTQATEQAIAGWTLAVAGGTTTVAGGLIGPGTPDGNTIGDKLAESRNVLVSTVGVALVALGWNFINRSQKAAEASSAASDAIAASKMNDPRAPGSTAERDEALYARCLGVRSTWMDGVIDSPEVAMVAPRPPARQAPSATPATPAATPSANPPAAPPGSVPNP